MELCKRVVNRGDSLVKEIYNVVLENPFYNEGKRDCFGELFINYPEKIFQIPKKEKKVLNFYKNCALRLHIKRNICNILKHKGDFYRSVGYTNFFNSDKSRGISIHSLNKIDFNYWNSFAINNLARLVQDNNLSLGDKKIIKDIAIKSFHDMVEISPKQDFREITFSMCVRTDLHETAANELRIYGFKIKHPHQRFKDIKLI